MLTSGLVTETIGIKRSANLGLGIAMMGIMMETIGIMMAVKGIMMVMRGHCDGDDDRHCFGDDGHCCLHIC